jgi:hypothetical protein
MSTHNPFLMGAETEYAVSGLRDGEVLDPDDVYDLLAAEIKRLRAWVADHHGYRGMYLQHGGRLYLDYGSHPEHATPECFTPKQVAMYDKAGEYLLGLARDGAVAYQTSLQIRIVKNNLDPIEPEENTYGTHESYTLWNHPGDAAEMLLGHLVSRAMYAGAGGLCGEGEGIGFELSQRARHMELSVGDDTTSCRAIFGTRVRKPTDAGDNWVRVHLICKDSQRAPLGTYLTFATTGLLIEMLNRGYRVGKGLAIVEPVGAMKTFSRDPYLHAKVLLADGRKLSALELQSAYLAEAERAVQAGNMPEWAGEAVTHWRQTLTDLERDPLRLADRLDGYCKLLIVEHELMRAGYGWNDLKQAIRRLTELRACYGERVCRAVLTESDVGLSKLELEAILQARRLAGVTTPGMLAKLHFVTRLQALDLQYHEVGGLYDRLRDAGRMKDVILTQADIEEASRVPPAGGRAAVRGEWIREHREDSWRGDWQYLWNTKTGACVDLRNPFHGKIRPTSLALPKDADPWDVEVLELLANRAAHEVSG